MREVLYGPEFSPPDDPFDPILVCKEDYVRYKRSPGQLGITNNHNSPQEEDSKGFMMIDGCFGGDH